MVQLRKIISTYNSVNQIINTKLPFLRNLLKDGLQQMEDTGSREVKVQHRRQVKDFPGRQQRAAQTNLLRLESEEGRLLEV